LTVEDDDAGELDFAESNKIKKSIYGLSESDLVFAWQYNEERFTITMIKLLNILTTLLPG
jgi:hypothetical protein